MHEQKSVLILTPEIPFPPHKGSQQRMDAFIRVALSAGFKVSLSVLNSTQKRKRSVEARAELLGAYPGLHEVQVRRHPRFAGGTRQTLNRWRDRLPASGKSFFSSYEHCPTSFRRATRQLVEKLTPDVVLVNYAKLTNAVPRSFRGRLIVDTHDIQTNLNEQAAAQSDLPFNRNAAWEDEARLLRRFDCLIAINPNEARELATMVRRKKQVVTVPAFFPVPKCERRSAYYDLLFVGSPSRFNIDACVAFVSKVLPLVRAEFPGVRFAIAGDVGTSARLKESLDGSVTCLGRVQDLKVVYERSAIVVCPLTHGAGMKIKVIEALMHARPLVTTSVGADGIDLRNGKNAFIADEWPGFAASIIALLKDQSLRARIAQAGHATAIQQHSVAAVREPICSILEGYATDHTRGDHRVETAPKDIEPARRPRCLAFAMDARALMQLNIRFGDQLARMGVYVEFFKMEDKEFGLFHEAGFIVHALKKFLNEDAKASASIWEKTCAWDPVSLEGVYINGIDVGEEFRVHREMFPAHYADEKHLNVVRHAVSLIYALLALARQVNPDFLVAWNGNGPTMIFVPKIVGKILGVPVLHVERGLLPDSIAVDAQGVNFKSSIAGSYLPLLTAGERHVAQSVIAEFRSRSSSVVAQAPRCSRDEVMQALGLEAHEEYLFFPEQIEGDSNIILNSPTYKLMSQTLIDLLRSAEASNLRVVCKQHPENSLSPSASIPERVIVAERLHLHDLIANARVVAVINSTVGLESLLLNTPTVALGNSVYSGKGLTLDATGADSLTNAVRLAASSTYQVSRPRLEAFIYLLLSSYLVSWSQAVGEDLRDKATTKALHAGGLSLPERLNRNLPPRIARQYREKEDELRLLLGKAARSDQTLVVDLLRDDTEEYWTGPNRQPALARSSVSYLLARHGVTMAFDLATSRTSECAHELPSIDKHSDSKSLGKVRDAIDKLIAANSDRLVIFVCDSADLPKLHKHLCKSSSEVWIDQYGYPEWHRTH